MQYRLYLEGEEEYGYIESFENKKKCDAHIKIHYPDGGVIIEPHLIIESKSNALANVKNTAEHILKATGATKYDMYLTGKNNFRNDLVDYYKANRKDARKPKWYNEIREYLIEFWGAEVIDGMEADDAMGIAQWNTSHLQLGKVTAFLTKEDHQTIICTLDKDLDCIPGWHYNWVKRSKYWVTEDEATKFYYTQLLTGDSTDNITGVPKCGPVTARKILDGADTEDDMYTRCLATYEKAYPNVGKEKLLENARLLWILRETGVMWQIPKI